MVAENHLLTAATFCSVCSEWTFAIPDKVYHEGAVWVSRIRRVNGIQYLRLRHEQRGYTVMHEYSAGFLLRAVREMGGILW